MPKSPEIPRVQSAAGKNSRDGNGGKREILIELIKIGNSLRINAIDVPTGTEVTFQAPLNTAQPTIQRIAADKLDYVLAKGKNH